jgi:hypothetical protein
MEPKVKVVFWSLEIGDGGERVRYFEGGVALGEAAGGCLGVDVMWGPRAITCWNAKWKARLTRLPSESFGKVETNNTRRRTPPHHFLGLLRRPLH